LAAFFYGHHFCFVLLRLNLIHMKTTLFVSLLFFGLISCGDTAQNHSSNATKESVKTGTDDIPEPLIVIDTLIEMPAEISERVNRTFDAPYRLDKNAIESLENSDNWLSEEEVELLSQHMLIKPGFGDIDSRMKEYFQFNHIIDSIGEEAYQNQMDLGMTRNFDAYLHDRVNLSENTYLLIWSFDYSTYEACPFYAGQYVLATMCTNGKISNTVFIGEDSGGGDPPYMGSVLATSNISDAFIEITHIQEYTGEVENDSEIIKSKCRFLISDNNIELDQ
jgi:hypothetical protein